MRIILAREALAGQKLFDFTKDDDERKAFIVQFVDPCGDKLHTHINRRWCFDNAYPLEVVKK